MGGVNVCGGWGWGAGSRRVCFSAKTVCTCDMVNAVCHDCGKSRERRRPLTSTHILGMFQDANPMAANCSGRCSCSRICRAEQWARGRGWGVITRDPWHCVSTCMEAAWAPQPLDRHHKLATQPGALASAHAGCQAQKGTTGSGTTAGSTSGSAGLAEGGGRTGKPRAVTARLSAPVSIQKVTHCCRRSWGRFACARGRIEAVLNLERLRVQGGLPRCRRAAV